MAKPTTTIQFTTENWDAIERAAGKPIQKDRTRYHFTAKGSEEVRFLYGDWLTNRDGVWSASKEKPRGV